MSLFLVILRYKILSSKYGNRKKRFLGNEVAIFE